MIHHFLFVVQEKDVVLGYDIYDTRKNIVNHTVKPGCYLAFYTRDKFYLNKEEDLINFLYEEKVLMIRKKIALRLKL